MNDEFESGALDEGGVFFRKLDDDTFAIVGSTLLPGEQVEVTSKNGTVRQVIVGKILSEDDGIMTAEFDWVAEPHPDIDYSDGQVYFHGLDNGDYVVTGMNLVEGETATVSVKDGGTKEVIVTKILDVNEDGIQTATFEWPRTSPDDLVNDGRIVFTRLEGDEWAIRGKGLETGKTVKVSRKGKTSKEKVIVAEIIQDENGIQTAKFTNPPNEKKDTDND